MAALLAVTQCVYSHIWKQDYEKYANTTSLVVTVIGPNVTTKLDVTLQQSQL